MNMKLVPFSRAKYNYPHWKNYTNSFSKTV